PLSISKIPPPSQSPLFPYTTLFRSSPMIDTIKIGHMIGPPLWNLSINQLLPKRPGSAAGEAAGAALAAAAVAAGLSAPACAGLKDRKSTRLNSSHEWISYAVFCLKK